MELHDIISILFTVWLGISFGAFIYGFVLVFKKHVGFIALALIGALSICGSIYTAKRYSKSYNDPENTYQRLKDNFSKADKELRKFYIDHPEFEGQ